MTNDMRVGNRVTGAIRIKLKYPDTETFIQRYAINLARGGMFVATREVLPVGTLLRFEINLENGGPVIRGEGEVVWLKEYNPAAPSELHGMGLRFVRLDRSSRDVLRRVLAYKEKHLQQFFTAAPDPYTNPPAATAPSPSPDPAGAAPPAAAAPAPAAAAPAPAAPAPAPATASPGVPQDSGAAVVAVDGHRAQARGPEEEELLLLLQPGALPPPPGGREAVRLLDALLTRRP